MDMEDDEGAGSAEEELYAIIKAALQRSTVKVVKPLSPTFVLDLFMERNLFGDMTTITVTDIRAISKPSEKNSTIHKKISVDPTRYSVFKECLAATRQRDLLDVLEKAEDEAHAEIKENGCCSACRDGSTDPCTVLASLKCNIDHPVSTMFSEAESLIRKAILRSTHKVTTGLKPDAVLDLFEERSVFGNNTSADDIRALSEQSEKSRVIYNTVSRDWRLYLVFKESLAATRQIDLLNSLEKIEEDLHTEMKANGGCNLCQDKDTCQMMASLRCDRGIPLYLPPTVRDTQKHLIELYQQNCMKVPIYPLVQEEKDFVGNIFVVPNMLEMDPHGAKISTDQNSSEKNPKKLKDIRGIFFGDEKLHRDIYLVAEGGTGKSTLCEYLVHLWVEEHSEKDSEQRKSGDKSFMKEFVLLFYISLRDAQGRSIWDIEKMIEDQLDLEKMDESKLLLNNTCLIILDGLDEYSLKHKNSSRFISASLPWRNKSKSTILTTSRPWKMEVLAREEGVTIDRQILITGLESKSQGDLAKNVIAILNVEREQNKNIDDFIRDMRKQKLDIHMKTPVLLMQMVGLWFDEESFGKSQCEIYSKMIEKQIEFAVQVKKVKPQFSDEEKHIPVASDTEEHRSTQTKSQKGGFLHKVSRISPKNLFRKRQAKSSSGEPRFSEIPVSSNTKEPFSGKLPTCFTQQYYWQTCQGLLLKLSKLAYHFLFGSQESALVFDHRQMEEMGLSEGEINTYLNLGLLTQYKVLGKKTQRQKSISFVHKSHQEFFAAVYLWQTGLGSELKKLLDSFTDLDRALQVEKVLLFVSGMNPAISREIAEVIMTVASSDSRIKQYRESRYRESYFQHGAPDIGLVLKIQSMIIAAIEESRNNDLTMPAILLQDIGLYGVKRVDLDLPEYMRIFACTQHLQLHHVRSIHIMSPFDIPRDEIWQLVKDCSPQLTKLVLDRCDINAYMLKKVVKRNRGSLQTIGLYSNNNNRLDLSPLDDATLKKIVSPQSLGLEGVYMSHEQLEFVYKHIGKRSHRQVDLDTLHCKLHVKSSCKPRLDLSASRQLNWLRLGKLPVQEVKFQPDSLLHCYIEYLSAAGTASAIRSLRHARSLQTFYRLDTTEYAAISQELVTTLPQLDSLRRIELRHIDMTCTQQHVFPDHMKALESIWLLHVTLRAEQLRELLAALPSHSAHVFLSNVTITDFDRSNNILEQTAASQRTEMGRGGPCVTYGHDTCVVESFAFSYTN